MKKLKIYSGAEKNQDQALLQCFHLILEHVKNENRIYHDYEVGTKVIVGNNQAHKHKTTYKGQYNIINACTNGTDIIKIVETTDGVNINRINSITPNSFMIN